MQATLAPRGDETLRERLREAKGIGTPATRAEIISGLKRQGFLAARGQNIVPTEQGLALFEVLGRADTALVDPGVTAELERLLDAVMTGRQPMRGAIDAVCDAATRIIGKAGGPQGAHSLARCIDGAERMFSTAVPIAASFTRPVVISSRTTQGVCAATIGTYVVVNREGWILTAGHLLDIVREHQDSARRHAGYRGNVVEFQRGIAADKRYRKKGVRTFHRPVGSSVRNHSVWWGVDGVRLVEARIVPAADLTLGRLDAFDPASFARYPVWKDPSRGFAPGRSLCKLGFPLHRIVPVYDEKANTFTLPEGSVPLPLFSVEGMFTRVVNARAPGSGDGEPSAFIETSKPILVGQMGGPVFDAEAVVWGIQSHTMHHALGFSPPVPSGAAGEVEHQFLNTRLAVHAAVIRRVLDAEGIAYRSEG